MCIFVSLEILLHFLANCEQIQSFHKPEMQEQNYIILSE